MGRTLSRPGVNGRGVWFGPFILPKMIKCQMFFFIRFLPEKISRMFSKNNSIRAWQEKGAGHIHQLSSIFCCTGCFLSDQYILPPINSKYNVWFCYIYEDLHNLFGNSKYKFWISEQFVYIFVNQSWERPLMTSHVF